MKNVVQNGNKKPILIFGASGHAKVVADILLKNNLNIRGFLEDIPENWGKTWQGIEVLGKFSSYKAYGDVNYVVAVGNNNSRKKIVQMVSSECTPLWVNAIHPRAIIAEQVIMGKGNVVAANVNVGVDCVIGDHTILNTSSSIDHNCHINNFAHVAPNATLTGGVSVSEGVFIGAGATIIPKKELGSWSVIGAGSVVTKNIPSKVIAKGVPCKW